MYYDYDDYYNEPSEFEQQIMELKNSLVKAVKKEHQEEIECLRKENAELQDIKNRIKDIETEHRQWITQIERDRKQLESTIKRARLKELLSDNFVQAWGVENNGELLPKCDKCNKNRYIHYKTPMGRPAQEQCSCNAHVIRYEPLPIECYEFIQSKTTYGNENYPRISIYYSRSKSKNYDEYERTSNIYKGESFEEIKKYGIVFLDKDKCQKYCDWLNVKEKIND